MSVRKAKTRKLLGNGLTLLKKLSFNLESAQTTFITLIRRFRYGLIATTKVITRSEYYGRQALLQPRNRGWVTVIVCTNASGWALPCMIFKDFIEFWFDGLPSDRRFDVSPVLMDRPQIKLVFAGLKTSLSLLKVRGFVMFCQLESLIPLRVPIHCYTARFPSFNSHPNSLYIITYNTTYSYPHSSTFQILLYHIPTYQKYTILEIDDA